MQEDLLALGRVTGSALEKASDFKACEGIENQCYSKTSFTPTRSLPLPCGYRGVTEACLGVALWPENKSFFTAGFQVQ